MKAKTSVAAQLRKKIAENWQLVLFSLLSVTDFILLWAISSTYLEGTESGLALYLPGPAAVFESLVASFTEPLPGFNSDVQAFYMTDLIVSSLIRVFWGFAVALALAFPLGILMGRLRMAEAVGRPIVEVFRPIPPLAWVPIFLIVLGSFWGPVGIVFLGAFFPILFNVMFGVRSVDPMLIDAARTLGAKRGAVFQKVIIPSAIPYMMTGVTIGLGIAWMCIVAAEMTGLQGGVGLGYYIMFSSYVIGQYEYTYATMIVIGILSVLTTGAAAIVERRVSKWMGMR